MTDLQLSFAIGSTARLQGIVDGEVRPEGIDLRLTVQRPGDIFWAMPLSEPYDVAEMSLTGYLWAIQHGKRWVAIPVFPGWVFGCHADSLVNVHSGIERTEDLRGKRVGVPEYAVTAIAWIRDAWERHFGVRPQDIHWLEERTKEGSHYRPLGYEPPSSTTVEIIPSERRLCDMLISGEIDAVTRYFGGPHARDPGAIDRSPLTMEQLADHPNVRWLYPDRKGTALDYCRSVGWPQPIHCVIVKQEIVDQHPWVPRSIYDACAEAAARSVGAATVRTSFPFPADEQRELFGEEFSPVGLGGRNREILARLLELAEKDGFLVDGRRFSVEDLFHLSTLS